MIYGPEVMQILEVPVYLTVKKQPDDRQVVQTAAGELMWNKGWGRFVCPHSLGSVLGSFVWWSPRICDIKKG